MSDSDTVERKSAVGPEQGEQVTPASIGNSGGRQASARWSPFVAPSSSMNRQLFGDGTASMSIHPPGFPRFPGIWGGELGQSASHDTRQDYESVHPRVVARRTNDAGTCNDLSTGALYKDLTSIHSAESLIKPSESGILGSSNDERHKTAGDHVCEYCGRWCDKPSTLATHMNSHTGARRKLSAYSRVGHI